MPDAAINTYELTITHGTEGPLNGNGDPIAPRSMTRVDSGYQVSISFTAEALILALLEGTEQVNLITKNNDLYTIRAVSLVGAEVVGSTDDT